ncbi:hypothetical protein MAM1_0175d07276 [Mucor ambiguus]|uniref:Uncharacterized protein n=1 Tax=Mucor ambiguus TaxID=91626 RepID=A0A0C9MWB2_9FUNG|nr:hypothetical protein MAM1_0175d07276 [Mucor ambiguus]
MSSDNDDIIEIASAFIASDEEEQQHGFKNTKVKMHPYFAHRVNESPLITVYSITPMMAEISDTIIFIHIKLKE